MNKIFKIKDIEVNKCSKFQGFLNIYDTEFSVPVTIINGENTGKTVLITAGIHGSEYPCIKTAINLAKEIDPSNVNGTIIIVHPVNTQGFLERVSAIIPEDKKNLNRLFPGDINGTIGDKIAYFITNELQSIADFYIDMHGGDLHEGLYPYVYYPGIGHEDVINYSKKIAECLNVDYMVKSSATTGAYNSCAINGTPSILIERGGMGLCKSEDVKAYRHDMLNILSKLEVLNKEYIRNEKLPLEICNVKYIDSTVQGCLDMFVVEGEKIVKGQKLYEITDFFGSVIDEHYAEFDGVILYRTVSYSIPKDASVIAYGEI